MAFLETFKKELPAVARFGGNLLGYLGLLVPGASLLWNGSHEDPVDLKSIFVGYGFVIAAALVLFLANRKWGK